VLHSQNTWFPERFFYSHATSDDRLTALVTETLEGAPGRYQVYAAERRLVGKPLMEKLRDELLNCNAILVGWTTSASSESSEIISFEVGMAFSLGMPVYMLRCACLEMPWFFSNLTDYADLPTITRDDVKAALAKIEPLSFCHPVDLVFPPEQEPCKQQSVNPRVVRKDGTINLPAGFSDIVHFCVKNRRQHPERDVRLILAFPGYVTVKFDQGTRDGSSGVQRNEMFDMWQAPVGYVRLYWASMPLDPIPSFELRLSVHSEQPPVSGIIECQASSDRLIGWRRKVIPLSIVSGDDSQEVKPDEKLTMSS
jgi:hypothetical protein